MLEQCRNHSQQCANNVATLRYAKKTSARVVPSKVTLLQGLNQIFRQRWFWLFGVNLVTALHPICLFIC